MDRSYQDRLQDLIYHYLHVLNKEYEKGFNDFVFENIFKTAKFRKMLSKNPSKLFLIYASEYDPQLHTNFFDGDNFIYAQENFGPPIGDFMFAGILCATQEDLNLFKLIFNMEDKEVTDISTMLEKIKLHMGDNNV